MEASIFFKNYTELHPFQLFELIHMFLAIEFKEKYHSLIKLTGIYTLIIFESKKIGALSFLNNSVRFSRPKQVCKYRTQTSFLTIHWEQLL